MMKSIRKEAVQDTARYFNITSFEELIIENETMMKKIKTANDTVAGTNPNARLIEVDGREIYVKSANLETEKKKPSLMEKLESAKEQVKAYDKQKEPTLKKNP